MAVSKSVVPDPEREGQFAFLCPQCEFVSAGWPTKSGADQRGKQHANEHETGEPVPELIESGIPGAVAEGA